MSKQTNHKEELFIVQKMIEGDMDAFKYFFEKYYADLCNFVNIYVNDRILAEEIVQDIFVYFWENKAQLRLNHSVKAYLFNASKYRSLNEIRNKNTRDRIHTELAKSNFYNVSEDNDNFFDPEKFQETLSKALEQLPAKCKEIFILSKHENLSNKDIALKLNISIKTVENQMTIAFKKLRAFLEPYRGKIFVLFLLYLFS